MCKLMFEKKKKKKAHKPTSPQALHGHQSPQAHTFLSYRITQGVLMKFMWEPYSENGLHILNTYPHYTGSFGALSEFLLAVDCIACFSCDALDYFSIGALNERSVDSNLGVAAAWEHFYYYFLSFLSYFFSRNYFL